jgi:hypothetical protein
MQRLELCTNVISESAHLVLKKQRQIMASEFVARNTT